MFKINKKCIFILLIVILSSGFLAAAESICSPKKLCLTMIVKNESAIIERLLNSVKNVVDCISICDTGSTDNTVLLIEQFMQKNGIPGKVYKNEWKNFGYNRSLSAKLAQQTLESLNFSLSNTWLLLLDADMILETSPAFNKQALAADSYLVLQKSSDHSYYNSRLIRASLPWECLGVTHEVWTCSKAKPSEELPTLLIDDKGDGGSKSDKFERDINLLTQGVKDEPDNARYVFYLAQSYHSIGNYPLALQYLKKRVEMGGWDEEVFQALFQIALIQEVLEMPYHEVVKGYQRAYRFRPSRAEPLYYLSNYYRSRNEYDLGYSTAVMGKTIPVPKDHLLILDWVYSYGMKLELSICAYSTGKYEECRALSLELLQNQNLPDDIRATVENNLVQCKVNPST